MADLTATSGSRNTTLTGANADARVEPRSDAPPAPAPAPAAAPATPKVWQPISRQIDDNHTVTLSGQATLDQQRNIKSAEATAALKTLLGNATIDTSAGIVISNTDHKLTPQQFKASVQAVLGPGAKFAVSGKYTMKPGEVSHEIANSFTVVHDSLTVDGHGQLVLKNGKASGEVAAQVTKLLGPNTIVAGNVVRFKDNEFQSADLNRKLTHKFGSGASLATTLKASIDREGAISAETTAAYCALVGNTTINTSAGLTITNNSLSKVQFSNAIKRVFGPQAQLDANGAFTWAKDKDGKVSKTAVANFKAVHETTQLSAGGTLQLKDGVASGDANAKLVAQFGTGATLTSDNKVTFKGNKITSAQFNESLKKKYGETDSVGASVGATFTNGKLDTLAVGLEAFKQLKQLEGGGHIDVSSKGNVVIKDGSVQSAEVEALLSAVAQDQVKIGAGGKLQYASGKPNIEEFSASLGKAWGTTSATASGQLRFVDGKPQTTEKLSALFGGADLKGGADITIAGADSVKANLKLTKLREGSKLDVTGGFSRANGATTVSAQTNLVKTGEDISAAVGGVISVKDGERAAQLKAQLNAGVLHGVLGVGLTEGAKLYKPTAQDPGRLAATKDGSAWSERSVAFDYSASAGVSAPIQVGAASVSLGFKGEGAKSREAHLLTLHPSEKEALAEGPVNVIRPPDSVTAIQAMKPFEQYSDSGMQSIGMTGNVSVGYGVGAASVSVGGQVYYQVTGNLSRDIEKLDGNLVRVRFRQKEGKNDVKAFSASVGLKGSKLGDGAVASAVAPLVENVAQIGFKASLDKTSSEASVFDVTVDLSTERGRAAMENMLKNDLSEAQYWARFKNSGVKLNSAVTTTLQARTKDTQLNLAGLDAEHMTRWLEKTKTELTPDSYAFTEAVDFTAKSNHLFPWQATRMSDVRFLHHTEVEGGGPTELPPLDAAPKGGGLKMRLDPPGPAPTLANTTALLGVRVRINDAKSSLRDVSDTLGSAINVMNAVGYEPDAYRRMADFRDAVNAGIAPARKPLALGVFGDKRFGDTTLDLEGYVGPKGLQNMFVNADGSARTRADFERAYLDAAALTGDGSVGTDGGLKAAIEKKLHASLVAKDGGGYSVMKNGAAIGSLSTEDWAKLRKSVDEFSPPGHGRDGNNTWYQELGHKVGTWQGKAPRALFDLDARKWDDVNETRARATQFGNAMQQAAALRAENTPVAGREPGPLFNKPEAYFDQLNELFKKTVLNDGDHQTAALSVLTLAGRDGIYARAGFTVPKETSGQMLDAARTSIRKFGAASLMAGLQPTVNGQGQFEFAAGADPAATNKVAQALFGDKVKLSTANGRTTVATTEPAETEHAQTLATLLAAGRNDDGSLKVPANWSAERANDALRQVLGAPTTVADGRIVFDNRGYKGISISDALSVFGPEAFGARTAGKAPAAFALASPVETDPAEPVPSPSSWSPSTRAAIRPGAIRSTTWPSCAPAEVTWRRPKSRRGRRPGCCRANSGKHGEATWQ